MTPAEAYAATRDVFASVLSAQARAQGLTISVGQIYGMLDTAMTNAGIAPMIAVLASADIAAAAYDVAYVPPEEGAPEDLPGRIANWKFQRDELGRYPNLNGLIIT